MWCYVDRCSCLVLILFGFTFKRNYWFIMSRVFDLCFIRDNCRLCAADSRRLLTDDEVEPLLIFLLSHRSSRVQLAAMRAVAAMAENLVSRDTFGKLGHGSFWSLLTIVTCCVQSVASFTFVVYTACRNFIAISTKLVICFVFTYVDGLWLSSYRLFYCISFFLRSSLLISDADSD